MLIPRYTPDMSSVARKFLPICHRSTHSHVQYFTEKAAGTGYPTARDANKRRLPLSVVSILVEQIFSACRSGTAHVQYCMLYTCAYAGTFAELAEL